MDFQTGYQKQQPFYLYENKMVVVPSYSNYNRVLIDIYLVNSTSDTTIDSI